MRSPVGNHELRPLEGRPDDLWTRGDALVKLGQTMATTATSLSDIADSDVFKSQGTDKLAEMAGETADDLAKAAVRYEDTGRAIRTYANALNTAKSWISSNQSAVERAEREYQSAVDAKDDASRELSSLETVRFWETEPSAAELTASENAAANAASALTSAKVERDELWEAFDHTFEAWSEAYEDAVSGIQKAMDTADNNDGFWEFVDNALEVIGWVLVALTLVALVIGAPLAGLLGAIILGLSLLVIGLNALKLATGRGSWLDFGLSLVSLIPFGIGRALSKGTPILSTVVRGGRAATTSAIRTAIPRVSLLRPTTWAKPLHWLAAPWRARGALPAPPILVNPFRSMQLGGARTAQLESFLGTMRSSPWAATAPVEQFISRTSGAMPAAWKQVANTAVWNTFFAWDLGNAIDTSSDGAVREFIGDVTQG